MSIEIFGVESGWRLTERGAPVAADQVEETCHRAMEALLDIEDETHGSVHSAAVSASCGEARMTIEFEVDAHSLAEADVIAQSTLHSLVTNRLGFELTGLESQEVNRELELVLS